MSGILKDENDIMILDTIRSSATNLSILALIFGFIIFVMNISNNPNILILLFSGLIFWVGLKTLLADDDNRIIIDKKSQSVIIKSKPIKEIPFSDINCVNIILATSGSSPADDLYDEYWYIQLTTTQNGDMLIYRTHSESDAEEIAEKVGRLMDKSTPLSRLKSMQAL